MIVLYGTQGSGAAAVEAALEIAGVPYRSVEAASWKPGSPGLEELRGVNPLAQIPTVVLPDGGVRWLRDPANKAEATQLLADRLQLAPEVAAKSHALATDPVDGMAKDAKFDLEGFRNVLKLRAEIEGQWGGTPPAPDKYIELSYYDKALAGL